MNQAHILPRGNRWHFLTEPYDALLEQHIVKVLPLAWPEEQYRTLTKPGCEIRVVVVPPGLPPFVHELAVRGLLAASYGIDTSDWPVPLVRSGERA